VGANPSRFGGTETTTHPKKGPIFAVKCSSLFPAQFISTDFTMRYSLLILALALLAVLSCKQPKSDPKADAIQRKTEPYDQFSFQRSYPYPTFDDAGWRKQIVSLRADFIKSLEKKGSAARSPAADWTLQGPGNVAGRVNTLAVHPSNENTVLAGFSAGGIFKTTDGGVTWKPVFDNHLELSIGHIVYDPNNPNILYAGTGDPNIPAYVFNGHGVYKSTDGGETWNYLGLGQEGIVSKVFVDPSNSNTLYAAVMGNPYIRDNKRGVYKSTDGGITWQNVLFVSNQAGASDLVINSANPQILYASFWDRIRSNQESIIDGPNARVYKTTNGGATWTQLGGGLPTGKNGRTGLAISKQNPDKVYVVYVDTLATTGTMFKTENGGTTWTPVNILALEDACGNFAWYFGKIRLNPTNDEEVYFLGVILWRKDAGSTQWQIVGNSHADVHDLQFAATGKRYLGCDGGVYAHAPGQQQWTKSKNLPTTQFYHTSYNLHEPNVYYGGAQDNGINRGNSSSYNSWASVFPADGFRCAFHPLDPLTFWVETQNGEIHKTTDGGLSWQFGSPCIGTTDRCNWDMPYFLSKHNTTRLFAGTYRVYFSDNGSGWGTISGDLTDGIVYGARFHTITCLDESPVLAEKLLAGTSDGNVWRREPTGGWVNITTGLPNRYVTSVTASPTLSSRIFVTHSGFRDNEPIPHVHRSNNNGATWTNISGNLPNIPVNDLLVLPGHADSVLFVGTDVGVYVTLNGGAFWQRLGASLPFVPVFDLERNPVRNELMAASYARGLWTFPLDSVFSLPSPPTVAVSGTIRTEDGLEIAKVRVCDQPLLSTGANGTFEILSNAPCLANGLYPKRTDDPLNGVTTFDLVIINRHILGIEAINSPYKMIAADANNSRSITTFDIVTLRKLILGLDTVLASTDSWRFVPANYTFPNQQNPFSTMFPEGISIDPSAQPVIAHFTGLKVGDVNSNATPNLKGSLEERTGETWPLYADDRFLTVGEEVRVVFSADWSAVAGAQFTLGFDPGKLTLRSIEPLAPGLKPEHFGFKPGGRSCFTACFENMNLGQTKRPRSSSNGRTALFAAVFRVHGAGQLRDALQIGSAPTPAAAFRAEGTALQPVLSWEKNALLVANDVGVYPNPFGQAGVWLRQTEPSDTENTLRIFDATGKVISQKKWVGQQAHIPAEVFPQKGVYWYEVRQGAQKWSGKIVFQ
jgi:photosystem II stability/assembly factor-like uncharacterized protein